MEKNKFDITLCSGLNPFASLLSSKSSGKGGEDLLFRSSKSFLTAAVCTSLILF